MERLRSSRAKLLDRYRKAGEGACGPAAGALLVQEVMEQEWQTLRAADQSRPFLGGEGAPAPVSTCSALGPMRSPPSLHPGATGVTQA